MLYPFTNNTITVDDKYIVNPIKTRRIPVIIRADQKDRLPDTSGFVFPYYNTMLLPDRIGVMNFIQEKFGNIVGANGDRSAEAMYNLLQGWKSLATTDAGIALSHIIFGLSLALQTGALPAIVHNASGDYQGFVLIGMNFRIRKGPKIMKPVDKEDFDTALFNLDTHGAALRSIVTIINGYVETPKKNDNDIDEYYSIHANMITLPRQLHNILRRIKLKPVDTKEISHALKRLSFNQQYWNPKDVGSIEKLIKKISSGLFPDSDWPIPYKTQVMFTSNRYHSALSVFGTKAPSLSLTAGTSVALFQSKTGSTLTKKEGGRPVLPVVPIFILPLDEASAAWKQVFDNHNLYVRYKRNREGIEGAAKGLSPEAPNAQSLFTTLMRALPIDAPGRKRARDSSGVNQEAQDRLVKKQRKDTEANVRQSAMLMSKLGLKTSTRVESEAPAASVSGEEDEGLYMDE